MACTNPKEMRFRVFEYESGPLNETVPGDNNRISNMNAKYFDTGKEFTIVEDDDLKKFNARWFDDPRRPFNIYSIPFIMLKKVYGFDGNFAEGWSLCWSRLPGGTENYTEGYIGSVHNKVWHIKRVL